MVRLKSAYIIRCDEVVKDEAGKVKELHCTYLPESKSGANGSNIKVKGTLHWVSIAHAVNAEVRLYDRLFTAENVEEMPGDFKEYINKNSLQIVTNAYAEPSLKKALFDERYQLIRKGYFTLDMETSEEKLVFNRAVTLKDTWAKEQNKV